MEQGPLLRYTYTVFLQMLGRYLAEKADQDQVDEMYGYGQASLRRYAGPMAQHEYPYLAKPQGLEYPTETWAAQEARKSGVFAVAEIGTLPLLPDGSGHPPL